jgi:hypothetical protein
VTLTFPQLAFHNSLLVFHHNALPFAHNWILFQRALLSRAHFKSMIVKARPTLKDLFAVYVDVEIEVAFNFIYIMHFYGLMIFLTSLQ